MSRTTWVAFALLADAILVNLGIIGAFLIHFGADIPGFNFRAYTEIVIPITLVHLIMFNIYDLYDPERTQSAGEVLSRVVVAVTISSLLTVVLVFFYRLFSFPRLVVLLSWVLINVLVTGWRILAPRVLPIRWPERRVLIVGLNPPADDIVAELKKRTQWGYRVVGAVDGQPDAWSNQDLGVPVLGTLKDIPRVVLEKKVDQIIVTSPIRHREVMEELAISSEGNVKVDVIPDLYEISIGRLDHSLLSDIPLVAITREPTPQWVRLVKRGMDILAALLTLALTLPFLLIAAAAIKLNSPGPVLFRQERVGKNQRRLRVYKLRTMVADAEEETGPVWASENDPRVTPVGRVLRVTRLDEIPQLMNVLKGEMSFVGPRPERPVFVEQFMRDIPGYAERFRVKPGLTGLAQVSGYYATTPQNKLKYDLLYIHHRSLLLDFKILLRTLKVVLTGKGAR